VLVVFWILAFLALVGPLRLTLYLFFMGQALGTFNTLGGLINVTPPAVLAPVLVLRIMLRALHRGQIGAVVDGLLSVRRLGLLSGFMGITWLVTATAPGFFAGVPIMGLNTSAIAGLAYTTSTLAQTIFLSASFATTVSIYVLMIEDDGRKMVGEGLVMGGLAFVLAGVLDLTPGSATFLAPLRNANYALLVAAKIGDLGRVVGLSTEASAYGYYTLAYACIGLFLQPGQWLTGAWRWLSPVVTAGLLLFTILSTSSAAYLGLAVMMGVVGAQMARDLVFAGQQAGGGAAVIKLGGVVVVLAFAAMGLLTIPGVWDALLQALDTILFQKSSSSSFIERSTWNEVSFHAVLETYGYGVGAGATRASSWLVALVAGGGFVGAALMLGFIALQLFSPMPGDHAAARAGRGARLGWLVLLVPAASTATSIDFGYPNAVFFAVMAAAPAIAAAQQRRRKRPRMEASGLAHGGLGL
jgi:hypothetical protein